MIRLSTTQSTPVSFMENLRADRIYGPNDFKLRLYAHEERDQVMLVWKKLEQQIGEASLACSADWTQTWLDVYGEMLRTWFVVAVVDEKPVGICLLSVSHHQQVGPFYMTSLHLGTAGEPHGHSVCVEYNNVLVEPRWREQFLRELMHLIQRESGWDELRLDGFSTDVQMTELPWTHRTERVRECRYFDLQTCRNEQKTILSQLGKSTRSNLKRRIKQLENPEFEWAETEAQAEQIFAELMELHQARWKAVGQPGAFASERFTQFQTRLINQLIPQQRVVLARLKSGGTTVGCLYLLVDHNRLLDYVSGFASFDQFPSGGLLTHYFCMEEAFLRGFDAYDFLVGEKQHKQNLGKSSQQLVWMTNERNRWPYRIRDAFRYVKQCCRPEKREGAEQ